MRTREPLSCIVTHKVYHDACSAIHLSRFANASSLRHLELSLLELTTQKFGLRTHVLKLIVDPATEFFL
jgi:hypothetical protein